MMIEAKKQMNEMNVMSFDVGIKNMAYCILSVHQISSPEIFTTVSIKDWNILNLMEKQKSEVLCNCKLTPKKIPKKKQKSAPTEELTDAFVPEYFTIVPYSVSVTALLRNSTSSRPLPCKKNDGTVR